MDNVQNCDRYINIPSPRLGSNPGSRGEGEISDCGVLSYGTVYRLVGGNWRSSATS
jgi:hypothetical protein